MSYKSKVLLISILLILILIGISYFANFGLVLQGGDMGFFESSSRVFLERSMYLWAYMDGFGGLGIGRFGMLFPLWIVGELQNIGISPFIIQYTYVSLYFIAGFYGVFLLLEYLNDKKDYIFMATLGFLYLFNFFSFSLISAPLYIFLTFYFLTPLIIFHISEYINKGRLYSLFLILLLAILNQATYVNITLFLIQSISIAVFVSLLNKNHSIKSLVTRSLIVGLIFLGLNIGTFFEYVIFFFNSLELQLTSGIDRQITLTSLQVSNEIYSLKNMLSLVPGNIYSLWWNFEGLVKQFMFGEQYQTGLFIAISYIPIILIIITLLKFKLTSQKQERYFILFLIILGIYGSSGYILGFVHVFPPLAIFRNINKFAPPFVLSLIFVLYIFLKEIKLLRIIFYIYVIIFYHFVFLGYFLNYYSYGNLHEQYQPYKLGNTIELIFEKYGPGKCFIYPSDDFILWGYKWGYVGYSPLLGNQNVMPCFHKNGESLSKGNADVFNLFKNYYLPQERDYIKYGIKYLFLHKDINYKVFGRIDSYNQMKSYFENRFKNVYENEQFTIFLTELSVQGNIIDGNDIKFIKINPTYYSLDINGMNFPREFVFLQSFHSQWKLYLEPYFPLDCNQSTTYTGTTIPEQVGTGTYIVKTRDTFAKIASTVTGATLSGVLDLNPGINDKDLKIGQKITIPKFSPPQKYNVTECESENTFYAGGEISKLWQKPIFDDTHKVVYDYANQWTIDPDYIKANYPKQYYKENPDGSIDIRMKLYFRPQSYFYLGLIISGTTILAFIAYLGYRFVGYKKQKKIGK